MFDHLQSIDICAIQFSQKQVWRYIYIQSLLTVMSAPICKGISTSMLKSCQLSGMFNLISVVQSLPVSLQHLVLEPDHTANTVQSSCPCLASLLACKHLKYIFSKCLSFAQVNSSLTAPCPVSEVCTCFIMALTARSCVHA